MKLRQGPGALSKCKHMFHKDCIDKVCYHSRTTFEPVLIYLVVDNRPQLLPALSRTRRRGETQGGNIRNK